MSEMEKNIVHSTYNDPLTHNGIVDIILNIICDLCSKLKVKI